MIFGRLFGGGEAPHAPPPRELPVVRDVTVGRTVVLDPLAWRRLGGEAVFALDRDTLEISAQGLIRLDDGGHVHRFYTDDELMLQAVSASADGADADDFTLFRPWSSSYPTGPVDRRLFTQRLRRPHWDEVGLPPYDRFWYPGDDREQEPVGLWEALYHDRAADRPPVRRIHQTCMLYARRLGEDGTELLLALEAAPEGGDVTHDIMIGLPLAPGEFRA